MQIIISYQLSRLLWYVARLENQRWTGEISKILARLDTRSSVTLDILFVATSASEFT